MSDLGLVRYDSMIHAIAECHRVDELKDMSDKARALEIYAKQARNTEAERKACDVRVRAERRCGELLRELERTPSGASRNPNGRAGKEPVSDAVTQVPRKSPYAQALSDAGLSRQRANRMEALANVPKEEFEAALSGPEKTTVSSLLERARTAPDMPRIDSRALWFWGRMREYERDGYLDISLDELLPTMTHTMRADVLRLLPAMRDLFERLLEESHELA